MCENITPPVAGARGQGSPYQSIRELKLKILLTGKNGQVGAELAAFLPRLGEVVSFERHELELSKPDQNRRAIREVQPNAIVNAAAHTAVDRAETDERQARIINVDAPAVMAEEAKKIGAVLVHYSTDYVFDGSQERPYDETDPPNPINVCGQTKFAGEEAIRAVGVPHLIFRTAWVYGTRGRNFLLTILRLATEREELKIVGDQFGAPTWSREIARVTVSALAQFAQHGQEVLSVGRHLSHDRRRQNDLVRICGGHSGEVVANIPGRRLRRFAKRQHGFDLHPQQRWHVDFRWDGRNRKRCDCDRRDRNHTVAGQGVVGRVISLD